jgi:hypothetical protein
LFRFRNINTDAKHRASASAAAAYFHLRRGRGLGLGRSYTRLACPSWEQPPDPAHRERHVFGNRIGASALRYRRVLFHVQLISAFH